jgi:maleate isomerase
VQRAITATFAREGFPVAAERHLDDPGNFSFAAHTPETVAAMIRAVAAEGADAAAVFCTNFRGTAVAAALEAEAGIPVLDSVALALWGAIRAAGGDPSRIRGWGRLFGI